MIDKNILYPLFLAFAISVALSPFIIPFLQRLKVGQTERKEGVQSHLKKAGTPTMGGLIILISVVVTSLFFIGRFPKMIPVLFLILGFGIIGFLDDYLKVVLRRSDGLYPKQKMLGQIIVTAVFVVYLWIQDPSSLENPDSVFRREGPERRLGADCIGGHCIPCDHRNGQWCQFYRRAGRACDRRDDDGSCVLYSGIGDFGCRN